MSEQATTIRRGTLIALSVLAFFVSILEPIAPISISENTYRSNKSSFEGIPDAPLDLGSKQQFCEAFYLNNVQMSIAFKLFVKTLSKRNTNIFQTDDLNKGFRIEISPEGKLNAFIQSPDGYGPEKVLSVLANDVVKANTFEKVNITVRSKVVTVQINDGVVVAQEGNFQPTCNHVLIGGGYDSTRTTIGEVQAVVRIQIAKPVLTFGLPMKARGIARIAFTLLLLVLAWEFRKKLFSSNDEDIS